MAGFTLVTSAVAFTIAEDVGKGRRVGSFFDALWWSASTITTVGYGDKYPTTIEGQLVAAVLMITGIALFSAGAGMFASWILADKKKS